MLPACEAMLFDFDGTLAVLNLDFAEMRRQVWEFTVPWQLPMEPLERLDILELIAQATSWLAEHAPTQAQPFARGVRQLLEDMEVAAAHSSGLLPGIPALLRALQQARIGVGVVTRNCDAAVRVMFPHIDTYCQAFVPRDHVVQVKPHPAHLQAALGQLRTTADRAIMVGDGGMDMQAGKALGMFCVGVLSGAGSRDSLLTHGADLIVASAADLVQYLPAAPGAVS